MIGSLDLRVPGMDGFREVIGGQTRLGTGEVLRPLRELRDIEVLAHRRAHRDRRA
jgi:hypothetical protein